MKEMKKLFAALLAAVMALSLAACGGSESTAADVAATYNRAIPDDSGYIATSMIEPFESAEVIDDYTVAIKTFEPYGPMLSLLCNYNTAIMDADYIEQYGRDLGSSVESVNGTGPYKLVDWARDEELDGPRPGAGCPRDAHHLHGLRHHPGAGDGDGAGARAV